MIKPMRPFLAGRGEETVSTCSEHPFIVVVHGGLGSFPVKLGWGNSFVPASLSHRYRVIRPTDTRLDRLSLSAPVFPFPSLPFTRPISCPSRESVACASQKQYQYQCQTIWQPERLSYLIACCIRLSERGGCPARVPA